MTAFDEWWGESIPFDRDVECAKKAWNAAIGEAVDLLAVKAEETEDKARQARSDLNFSLRDEYEHRADGYYECIEHIDKLKVDQSPPSK